MADALATLDDLSDWLGEVIEHEDGPRARSALTAASVLVRTHVGAAAQSWTDTPEAARVVALSCAARAYTNPEGWTYERVDDWGAGGRSVPESGLFLTPTEKRLLDALAESPRGGLSIISTDKPVLAPPDALDGVAQALYHG